MDVGNQSKNIKGASLKVLKLCLIPIKLPFNGKESVELPVDSSSGTSLRNDSIQATKCDSKIHLKGYTRILQLPSPQRVLDGYTHLKLPDFRKLRRPVRSRASNSSVKIEKRRRSARKPTAKDKSVSPLLTNSDTDNKLETSDIVHTEGDDLLSAGLVGQSRNVTEDQTEMAFSETAMSSGSATMLSDGGHQLGSNQKMKLAFDKNKFSSAVRRSMSQSVNRDSANSSEVSSNSSLHSERSSPIAVSELIPPSSPKPLEFDVPNTPKSERKMKKQRTRSKETVRKNGPNGEPRIDRVAAGDSKVDRNDPVDLSSAVQGVENKQTNMSCKLLSGSAKGLKRTARKTVNKSKYGAKELEMVREFTRKERQSSEDETGQVLPAEAMQHNMSLVLSTLSNVQVDRLDENRLRSSIGSSGPTEKTPGSSSPGIENLSDCHQSSDTEHACQDRILPQSNAASRSRKRLHAAIGTTASKTVKIEPSSAGPKSALECEDLGIVTRAASEDGSSMKQSDKNNGLDGLGAEMETAADQELPDREIESRGMERESLSEADVPPIGGLDQHSGAPTVTQTGGSDTAAITNSSLSSSCPPGEVAIDDDNYLPHSESKLAGVYRLPNGCRVATICKDGKLYCAAHELAMRLRLSLVGLTRIRCSDEEGNMIRMMGRGNLKDNFEFKVVPLSEILQLLSNQSSPSHAKESNSDSVCGKARGGNFWSPSSQRAGGSRSQACFRGPLTVLKCSTPTNNVRGVPTVPSTHASVHVVRSARHSATVMEVRPHMSALLSSSPSEHPVGLTVSVCTSFPVAARPKISNPLVSASSSQSDNQAEPSKSPEVIILEEVSGSEVVGRVMPPPPAVSSGTKAVIDMYEKMVKDDFGVSKALEKMKTALPFPVVHQKKLLHHSVAYNGELFPNIHKYSTSTPFVIRCSSCGTVFGPFDFMLHLEESDKHRGLAVTHLWNDPIERKENTTLSEKQVAFWNLFVDWFRLASKQIHDFLGAKARKTVSQVIATCQGQTTPTIVSSVRTTSASDSSRNIFDEIPASPAPFTSVSEQVEPVSTAIVVRHPETVGRRSSHPPTFKNLPSATISHRPLQQPQLVDQQRYSSQLMASHMLMSAQRHALREGNCAPYAYSVPTNNLVGRSSLRQPFTPVSVHGSTNMTSYRINPNYQRQPGADDHQRPPSYPGVPGARVNSSGAAGETSSLTSQISPQHPQAKSLHPTDLTTSSSSGSTATYSDLFVKALGQQRMSMLSIEENFRRLEQENASIKSQLTAERQEKQDYAIKLQKVIAESQTKDQQIQALKEELKRLYTR